MNHVTSIWHRAKQNGKISKVLSVITTILLPSHTLQKVGRTRFCLEQTVTNVQQFTFSFLKENVNT